MGFSFPSAKENSEFSFGPINQEKYISNLDHPLFVCYRYLQVDGKYSFLQSEMDHRDATSYFDSMQILSEVKIGELKDLDHDWHMYDETPYKGTVLYNELVKIFGEDAMSKVENLPPFFHFALYQDKGITASRETGKKSPRIHFFVGDNATIYPMFYDPYHEFNPMNI